MSSARIIYVKSFYPFGYYGISSFICYVSPSKSFVSTILAVFIFLNTLVVPLIYLDFESRRDYIADVLCINRTKPMTVCGGKCYLSSRLNKVHNQQDDQQTQSNTLIGINFFFNADVLDEISSTCTSVVNYKQGYIQPHVNDAPLLSLFQPPRV